ncbi:MAG: hypothetical protein HQ481_03530 [Alphaproteobacteria bacterium]|nr:hypothetical protein [Alphaproteobacteria bacterium]
MIPRIAKISLAAALMLVGLAGCNPYVWGTAAALTVPQAVTGKNTFYNIDKYFGRRCSDSTYFDRPVRCVNDRS